MIYGTGVDIIEIARMKRIVDKNKRILSKLFTYAEIQYFIQRKNNINTIAGYFAAKEAVAKAIGTGICGFKWKDIEIYKDAYGKPCVRLHNALQDICRDKKIYDILISISHSKHYSIANAIAVYEEGYNENSNT